MAMAMVLMYKRKGRRKKEKGDGEVRTSNGTDQ
ncbi:hypothetical protein CCACVL1_05704 [Corchorus capsularis]|uniref:Uncharacterized protein n=1 Tax=Corchorus capsularis TaxID=210143 RepID=A0A1R3JJA9_COCAP|nr:hypothetical protein CCACVL1_05704 [Corchorus capsularis]